MILSFKIVEKETVLKTFKNLEAVYSYILHDCDVDLRYAQIEEYEGDDFADSCAVEYFIDTYPKVLPVTLKQL
jgi:hypothetical protein